VLSFRRLAYLAKQKRLLGGKSIEHDPTQPFIVHSTYGYIGGLEELILWATKHTPEYKDPREEPEYAAVEEELQTLADREFAAYIAGAGDATSFVYLDFSSTALEASASGRANAGGAPSRPGTSAGTGSAAASRPGTQVNGRRRSVDSTGASAAGDYGPHRVIIELFTQKCPKTSDNFRKLCTGEVGEATDPATGTTFPLHYANTIVHRVVKDGWIQAGDIVSGRGCDGWSALGSQTFPDENLSIPLDAPGLVCMASNGPHTNASQFFITLRELPAFNGKHVVVGRVIFGQGTLELINSLPIRSNQRPEHPLSIVASDAFAASMLDENVNKWTRKRQPKKKKKATVPVHSRASDTSPRIPHKKATLLVVGVESSGKSTIVNNWLGRPWEQTDPTVGFNQYRTSVPPSEPGQATFDLNLWSLGGARNIRGYWTNYLDAFHGLVFVVDASVTGEEEWRELAREFQQLLEHELVRGKPVLVYANKQDKPNALSMTEVSMRLNADALSATSPQMHFVKCVGRTDIAKGVKHPVKETPLSPASAAVLGSPSGSPDPESGLPPAPAAVGTAKEVDPDIPRGLQWLLRSIAEQYQPLTERVARDVAEQKKRAKEEMEKSRARIAEKKEREAKEAEEAAQAAATAAK
jgi:cyclophilin family peptidyl-prolyl cis-trans isomerase/GTPase SAR1 family protein